jgi:hypothetical protein
LPQGVREALLAMLREANASSARPARRLHRRLRAERARAQLPHSRSAGRARRRAAHGRRARQADRRRARQGKAGASQITRVVPPYSDPSRLAYRDDGFDEAGE